MIAVISGVVAARDTDTVVVDVHGVGYQVHVPANTVLPPTGDRIRLHTYLHVREDALTLYGFLEADTKTLFSVLISASGVGPKLALTMLSSLATADIVTALRARDTDTLVSVPGIGKKVADRLVLELHDKALGFHADVTLPATSQATPTDRQARTDVHEALLALGYSTAEADKAVAALPVDPNADASVLLRDALTNLSNTAKRD